MWYTCVMLLHNYCAISRTVYNHNHDVIGKHWLLSECRNHPVFPLPLSPPPTPFPQLTSMTWSRDLKLNVAICFSSSSITARLDFPGVYLYQREGG